MPGTSLTNMEITELVHAGPSAPLPPTGRVLAALSELLDLRAAVQEMLKNCYPCNGTGKLGPDFDFSGEGAACGACHRLRRVFIPT
jgi:hypothetical protein